MSIAGKGKRKKICQTCGSEFFVYPSREKTAKFCSISCKGESRKNGTMRICETCGSEFYATPSGIKFTGARFCSNKCKDLANRNRVDAVCEWCGKEMEIAAHKAKSGRGKFCCVNCFNSWRKENDRRGIDNKFFSQVEHTCQICGTKFFAKKYRKRAKFCSNKCRGVWHSKQMTGANNANWRGGLSFEPYPIEFNPAFKRKIRKRDSYTCAVCLLPGKCVHHIDYDKSNTTGENCIVVCRSCHPVIGVNRQYWQSALQGAMIARGHSNVSMG